MRYAHPVDWVRAAEGELMARLPEGTLMQRAAAGLAATCASLLGRVYGSRVLVLAGSGDNGGDALYAGARLARRGARVHAALLAPERTHAAALAALLAAGGRVTADLAEAERADLVLDGIVGIGGRGPLREAALPWVAASERGAATVVAVDLPSGVDPDTGAVPGRAVHADVTVTFGTHKPGLLIDPGASHAGVLHLIDIGLRGANATSAEREPGAGLEAEAGGGSGGAPGQGAAAGRPSAPEAGSTSGPRPAAAGAEREPGAGFAGSGARRGGHVVEVLQAGDVAALLPEPVGESDKYRRGVVGIAAGSGRYPGAAVLAVGAALRGGAGAVRYVGAAAEAVVRAHPEALVGEGGPADAGRVQAWVVGPGLAQGQDAERAVAEAVAAGTPVLVDADGLRLLAQRGSAPADALLTPHAGEAVALLAGAGIAAEREQVEAERLRYARAIARAYGCTVLLKGSTTVVTGPEGPARVNPTGTAQLATAGSGDVLAGLAGALLAAGLAPLDAGSVAAYLHGLAGRLSSGGAPTSATAITAALPEAWRLCLDLSSDI
ncbi:bifunctional ADP-dependent NAD(P)H-hydrate dehydratase/NAD(P)H-hydrate epimerase [Streptacidiphilus rugosus]|uniref:bifunctional ADP-dependent NAD(P)H-hydrate dehydratase/NAD(P)H-hydrate epimerase n=1 Tax=Streptacidiphilus rugosus TaxID=405783 RepID=UPI000569AF75|nr:bifunctional ADP-dependent NAD(P)H-hydrate dehydratase/NAD(P)H-hydrate epimerase [Streptacidiphilus rugosus]